MISAIVVAAGKSSRMGNIDKLSLPFEKSTIIGTVLKNLMGSKVDEIVLVTSQRNQEIVPEDLETTRIKGVLNPSPEAGLTSSIQTGVSKAHSDNAYLVCLGDMPQISTSDYNLLINNYLIATSKVIIQPFDGSKNGNPVLFSNHFREDILNLTKTNGCKPIIKTNNDFLKKVKVTTNSFFTDIDTIEQYNKLYWS